MKDIACRGFMNINSLTDIRYWDNIGWTRMTKIEPSIFNEIIPKESEIVYTRRSTKTSKANSKNTSCILFLYLKSTIVYLKR